MNLKLEAPAFWTTGSSLSALLLAPLATVYGAVAARRMMQPAPEAGLPVICIGNYVAGGQGKTPTALAVARLARSLGFSPLFLTRGYGGRITGPVMVDRTTMTAADVGDEALLLAAEGPTVVARRRGDVVGSPFLKGADLIIMDDGFQSPSLTKTLSIVVADGATGIGNGQVLPAGPLRAPLGLQLARTDLLLVIDDAAQGHGGAEGLIAAARDADVPIGHGRLAPVSPDAFVGARVLAFAGIGRPEKFRASLAAVGADIVGFAAFGDHHVLAAEEAEALLARAERETLRLVTTAKDAARMAGASGAVRRLREAADVFDIAFVADEPAVLTGLLQSLKPPDQTL